jgi:hypothetical protein
MTRPTCTITRVEQVEPFLSSRQYFLTDALTRDSTLAGVVLLIICLSVSAVPVDSSGTCAFAHPSAGVPLFPFQAKKPCQAGGNRVYLA